MIGIALCVTAFLSTFWASKRSVSQGLIALFAWGYLFGILRANFLSTFTYFVYDSALLAFYITQRSLFSGADKRSAALRTWCWLLMGWPILMLLMPFQTFLVSLVGLRGAILFLPMMLAGGRLRGKDLFELSLGLAALNLVALAFGGAEYFMGVPRFYPENAATIMIYASNDVEGGFFRIPAIFGTAHLYGGAMVATLPFLISAWEYTQSRLTRWFILAGAGAALLGVLLSATRLNVVSSVVLVLVAVFNGKMDRRKRVVIIVLMLIMAGVAFRNSRFGRFKQLSDTDYVGDRISGSVNRGFLEVLLEYPMGNGLGGGGTNIPYFLAGQVRNPIGLENEYARILCEQGIIGLTLWLGFVLWFLGNSGNAFRSGPWATGRRLVWALSLFGLGIGAIGLGMLTAIPQTSMWLLGIGWCMVPAEEQVGAVRQAGIAPAGLQPPHYGPVPALESR